MFYSFLPLRVTINPLTSNGVTWVEVRFKVNVSESSAVLSPNFILWLHFRKWPFASTVEIFVLKLRLRITNVNVRVNQHCFDVAFVVRYYCAEWEFLSFHFSRESLIGVRRLRKGKKKGICVALTSIQRKTPSVITSKEALHNDGTRKPVTCSTWLRVSRACSLLCFPGSSSQTVFKAHASDP